LALTVLTYLASSNVNQFILFDPMPECGRGHVVLPGNVLFHDSLFELVNNIGTWWSATGNFAIGPWGKCSQCHSDLPIIDREDVHHADGLSVRCIKDY